MGLIERIHGSYVHGRRVRVLGERIANLMPEGGTILDVGCGDGKLAHFIRTRRPSIRISGVDVQVRPNSDIPVAIFDGRALPFPDHAFDVVLLIDVLHHTEDPEILLREAARVSKGSLVLKDHLREGILAAPTLRFMDRIGNARHGVALPHNYWTRGQWLRAFAHLGLQVTSWEGKLALYPPPADWLFGRALHFLATLQPASSP
jgi:SAM-dependent methyltransferase